MVSEFYFWEPSLSPHKIGLFRALARAVPTASCTYVSQEGLPEWRAREGWQIGNVTDLDIRISPSADEATTIVANASPDAIHLFSGIHWVPVIVAGLKAVLTLKRRFAIMMEPRMSEGLKGKLRLLHSWVTEGRIRRHAAFVLAIGRNGPAWFEASGYRKTAIFPFAYFLPIPSIDPVCSLTQTVRLTYLGRLTEAKGALLFMEAIQRVSRPCAVTIAGAGPEAARLEAFAAASRGKVTFVGHIAMDEVPYLLRRTDILVAPSLTTDDGWGVVVSEALMAGSAVIATDRVGASICLEDPKLGLCLRQTDPAALAGAIERVIDRTDLGQLGREARSEWAKARLSGAAGADYLLRIVDHILQDGPKPSVFYI